MCTLTTLVFVLQKIPFGNGIPSSGKEKFTMSPVGTSPINKVVPAFEVVVNSKTPAPLPSEAIIIPLNLIGPSIIADAPLLPLLILLLEYRFCIP